MNAVRAHSRGGPEALVYEQAPIPQPGPGEVQVAVHAAAITFAELGWDASWEDAAGADRTPVVPSHEISGIVSAVGDGVESVAIGDEVYALVDFNRDGGAAEYVVLPAADVAPRPASVSHVDAAALPLAALTAWQALVDHAHLQAGEHVLVLGASGGVGVYVVQLAAELGATVSATARGTDLSLVTGLGADLVLDYRNATDENVLIPADVVVDTVGGATLVRAADLVKPGGRLITLAAPPPPEVAQRDFTSTFFVVEPDRDELARIAALVDAGRLRPIVAQTYPLAQARLAFEDGPTRRRAGKTVLTVRD